jgi:hypothetical protein
VRYEGRSDSLEAFPPPGSWHTRGACVGAPLRDFFPDRGGTTASRVTIQNYCDHCPVRIECLRYAMACGPMLTGIWGGTTQHWRNKASNKAAWRNRQDETDLGRRSVA